MRAEQNDVPKVRRAFIDSNVFIYAAQAHPKFGSACKKIIEDIESRKIEAMTSVLNIAEVAEVIDRNVGRKAAANVIELLLALPMDIEDVVKEHEVDAFGQFNQRVLVSPFASFFCFAARFFRYGIPVFGFSMTSKPRGRFCIASTGSFEKKYSVVLPCVFMCSQYFTPLFDL